MLSFIYFCFLKVDKVSFALRIRMRSWTPQSTDWPYIFGMRTLGALIYTTPPHGIPSLSSIVLALLAQTI
jgi:hypothetical protein